MITTKRLAGVITTFIISMALCSWVSASEPESPYATVDRVATQLMEVARQQGHHLGDQPDIFYEKVGMLLDPVVDFDFIARAVMGPYAKQATDVQREAFAKVFRTGMIATYSKGIAGFVELKMQVVPADEPLADKRRVNVLQEVTGGESVNRVYYTMAKNRSGEWKLINMVINGVNLGETLRNQFANSMRQAGDIDTVIAQWGADTTGSTSQES